MQFSLITNHALVYENFISRQNGNAGDFSDAAGERKMAPKCGSHRRDAGDLVGLTL